MSETLNHQPKTDLFQASEVELDQVVIYPDLITEEGIRNRVEMSSPGNSSVPED